jgi:CRISPR-associated protein Csb1
MSNKLDYNALKNAVTGSAAAFRCRTKLQPAGGEGDKVFPPTFAGAVYAVEKRRQPGKTEPVTCVLLDSVQSQANRMEAALQDAYDAGELKLPLIEVDFSDYAPTGDLEADKEAGRLLDDPGRITSLQVPHRIADAILRDSELNGKRFRESEAGIGINRASYQNATPLYRFCPTALVFGVWDSTGPKGGLGAKFERAMVSEVVGVGAAFGVKTASRIDPLITKTKGIVLYETENGWTLDETKAIRDPKKKTDPKKLGKDGKVSESNLGNVTPGFAKYSKGAEGSDPLSVQNLSVSYQMKVGSEELSVSHRGQAEETNAKEGRIAPGGVTIEYAEQLTTLSLIALRRLKFPVDGKASAKQNAAGHAVLAALGLCAATLAFESGVGLRSRCLLWPEMLLQWELLAKPGTEPQSFSLDREGALSLLKDAITEATEAGLTWREEPLILKPSAELLKLVRKSQELAVCESDAEGAE